MTRDIKQLPWWKWTLLLIGAIVLASIGYALIVYGYDKASELQHPSLTIITVVLVLGIYALIRGFRTDLPAELRLASLIPHTLLGLVIGFVYVTLVVGTTSALGFADVSWRGFSWSQQWKGFIFFLGVAVAEVIIFIGVIFRMFDERKDTIIAFAVLALALSIYYIEPPSESIIIFSERPVNILVGLMFAAAYKWSGTLWLPIGIHWAWKYAQFNIYDALLCSGRVAGESMLTTDVYGLSYYFHDNILEETEDFTVVTDFQGIDILPLYICAFIYAILFTAIFLSNRHTTRRCPKCNS